MDGVEVIKKAVDASRVWYNGTVGDLTPELASYAPPGKVVPIGALVAHTVQGEDMIVNQMLLGQPTLWEREGWGEKLGIDNLARLQEDAGRSAKIDLGALKPYADAVFAETQAYLSGLSPTDLERTMELPQMGTMTVADVLTMILIGNNFAHTGEISALKGIQGAKGYPF